MRIVGRPEFLTWLRNVQKDGDVRWQWTAALLDHLRRLDRKPLEDSATLKRVRQTNRHEIWRLAHPFEDGVAVRILCWFPDDQTAVVALVGGDKSRIGDVWYDSAAPRAEASVDQWIREQRGEAQR